MLHTCVGCCTRVHAVEIPDGLARRGCRRLRDGARARWVYTTTHVCDVARLYDAAHVYGATHVYDAARV